MGLPAAFQEPKRQALKIVKQRNYAALVGLGRIKVGISKSSSS